MHEFAKRAWEIGAHICNLMDSRKTKTPRVLRFKGHSHMMTKALQNAHKSNHARCVAKIVYHNPIILGN
jgi:hypothetical protein